MPRPRVAMRRIGEVLRLKYELGLSDSEIARGARLARSTVREYLDRAGAAGLGYDEACALADEELDRRLFAARDARDMDRPLPDWEVKKPGEAGSNTSHALGDCIFDDRTQEGAILQVDILLDSLSQEGGA